MESQKRKETPRQACRYDMFVALVAGNKMSSSEQHPREDGIQDLLCEVRDFTNDATFRSVLNDGNYPDYFIRALDLAALATVSHMASCAATLGRSCRFNLTVWQSTSGSQG